MTDTDKARARARAVLALVSFAEAAGRVVEAWEQLDGDDRAALGEGYPFGEDFVELHDKIIDWKARARDALLAGAAP